MLECVPVAKRTNAAFRLLMYTQPGAALPCPDCNGLIGFDAAGQPQVSQAGWPIFRYGRAELEEKMQADGEHATTPLEEWALRHRFIQPGSHQPLTGY